MLSCLENTSAPCVWVLRGGQRGYHEEPLRTTKDIGEPCGFVRKDQWGLCSRCEEPSRMPGLGLMPRLYSRHTLVDGVATAQWFGGGLAKYLLRGCSVSLLQGPCRISSGLHATGEGADCDRRPGEGGCVSVFREGCAVREYWRRLRPPSRDLLTLWA